MKTLLKWLVGVFILWLPFSIGAILSIPITFWAIFTNQEYAKQCLKAQDKLTAALFGWGGDYTVSAECGSRQKDCKLCKMLCAFLNKLQPGHCEGAAKNEGLI